MSNLPDPHGPNFVPGASMSTGRRHVPIAVYEMPDGGQEALLASIEAGTARLAFRVCAACAPSEVLDRIEDGDLDLSDSDALDAQWPCHPTPEAGDRA